MQHNPDSEARHAIEAVLVEWAWLIDHGRAEDAAVLFTDDAEQSIVGVTAVGREAITQGLRRRAAMTGRTSRHVVSNLRLTRTSETTFAAQWVLTLYRSDEASRPARPTLVGDVTDTFRMDAGAWKLRSRTVVPVFSD